MPDYWNYHNEKWHSWNEICEKLLHTAKVTVSCWLWPGDIIVAYFSKMTKEMWWSFFILSNKTWVGIVKNIKGIDESFTKSRLIYIKKQIAFLWYSIIYLSKLEKRR